MKMNCASYNRIYRLRAVPLLKDSRVQLAWPSAGLTRVQAAKAQQ